MGRFTPSKFEGVVSVERWSCRRSVSCMMDMGWLQHWSVHRGASRVVEYTIRRFQGVVSFGRLFVTEVLPVWWKCHAVKVPPPKWFRRAKNGRKWLRHSCVVVYSMGG